MATAMTAAQRIAQAKKWFVPYTLYPDYATRGRGPMGDVAGYMIHHTGSDSQSDDYLDFLFNRGRPAEGIPAPLCHDATRMTGEVIFGAIDGEHCRANHAGSGSQTTLSHIRNADYDGYNSELHPGPDGVNGNYVYYGNEVMYDGGQPMTDAAYKSVVLDAASVCDFHGWSALHVLAHREHTTRKNDPGNELLYLIRRDVNAALNAGPGNWPLEEEMLTPAQATQLAKAGWLADQFAQGGQFEVDLNIIRSDLQLTLTNLATMMETLALHNSLLTEVRTKLDNQAIGVGKAGWLADQFAQGGQFEVDLNVIRADAQTALGKLDQLLAAIIPPPAPETLPKA